MCAIYGSSNRSMFDVLHDATEERGSFAFSYAFISSTNKVTIDKFDKHPNLDKIKNGKRDKYFLGHNQAPTSAQRDYDEKTSHPFVVNNWIVAHNGIITNFEKLNNFYTSWNKNPVDSSVIPAIISEHENKHKKKTEVELISLSLSKLEGTFAVWILNEKTGNIYIARQGSTLFGNKNTGDFCSIMGSKDWEELEEGKIYQIVNKSIKEIGEFSTSSPFFVL